MRSRPALKFAESMGAEFPGRAARQAGGRDQAKQGGYQGPDVDGYVLPEDVHTIFSKGKQNDVPLLIGSNADEGTMFSPGPEGRTISGRAPKSVSGRARRNFSSCIRSPPTPKRMTRTPRRFAIRCSDGKCAPGPGCRPRAGRSKTYLYFFSRVPPTETAARMGAYHSSEIAYVFDNVNGKSNPRKIAWQDVDRKLADTMSSYWVNFATTGDPNGKGLLKWPAFHSKDDLLLGFGDEVKVMPIPHKPALDFVDAYFEHQRQNPGVQPQ